MAGGAGVSIEVVIRSAVEVGEIDEVRTVVTVTQFPVTSADPCFSRSKLLPFRVKLKDTSEFRHSPAHGLRPYHSIACGLISDCGLRCGTPRGQGKVRSPLGVQIVVNQ
jgi:hypothetical protein